MNLRLVPRFCHIGYAISLDYYGQSERSWATSATVFSEVRLYPTASFFNSSLYCLRFPSMFSLTSFNLIIALNLVSNKAGEVHEYHEGMKVFEDLVKEKEWAISRMMELLSLPIKHKDVRRICKHIIRYNQELFTFLDNPLLRQPIIGLKQQLRSKVIMRKITFGNRSALGALNQAVMMSIRETSILNGIEPLNILLALSVKPLTSFTELPKIRSP
jgi:hypothetical protein